MTPVIPAKIQDYADQRMEIFETDTDFQIVCCKKKNGVFPKGGTPLKVFVWDPIKQNTIERHYLKTTDECREKVRELINGYKVD